MLSPALCLPAILCPVVLAAEVPANDTHQKIAQDIVTLLAETEAVLDSCKDEQSVKAALPKLQGLSQRAQELSHRQAVIAPPTIQDDIAANSLADAFDKHWQAICRHVTRLEDAGLLSAELRAVLRIVISEQ